MTWTLVAWIACFGWQVPGVRAATSAVDKPYASDRGDSVIAAGISTWTGISAGLSTCGVFDGGAYCWGTDSAGGRVGQLGNGPEVTDAQHSPTPVDASAVPPETTWATVSAGREHGCGLTSDGVAYCWGSDERGQLGNGPEVTDDQESPSPVDVSGLPAGTTWTAITAGTVHTCGITAEETAYCWGADLFGALGNGPGVTENQMSPSPVDMSELPAGAKWTSIDLGRIYTCGITVDGAAYCWGRDDRGQLGNGPGITADQESPSPVDISGLPAGTTWSTLSNFDGTHTCGVTGEGAAYCWGSDTEGKLGNGPEITDDQPSPSPVDVSELPGGTSWITVTAGGDSSCGITVEGTAYCWGSDFRGMLGNGPEITENQHSPSAVDVSGLPAGTSWVVVTSGRQRGCGLTGDATGYCWGRDSDGELGNGPGITDDQHSPSPVASVPPGVIFGPQTLDFGEVAEGVTADPAGVTVVSSGMGDVTVDEVSLPSAPFAAAGGTCPAPPFDLSPGERCRLDYTFTPEELGTAEASVTVTSDGPNSPHTFALQGVGISRLQIAPAALDFEEVFVGAAGEPLSVTLNNIGVSETVVSEVSDPGPQFAAAGGDCGTPPFALAAETSCTLDYRFQPVAVGEHSASVTLTSDALSSPDTVSLQGVGVSRAILDLAPESFDVVLEAGQTTVGGLEIGNPGVETLDWGITEAGGRILTHSESLMVDAENTIACTDSGATVENHFLRTFSLADLGVTTDFGVTEVVFGVELLTGPVTLTVNLHELEGEFTFDNLDLLGSATVDLAPQAVSLVTVPVTGTAPAGSTLVVEIVVPSFGELQAGGSSGFFGDRGSFLGDPIGFWPGSNDLGETAPSYVASETCDAPEPTLYSDLGFPNVHLVMTVTGTTVDCTLPFWTALDPLDGAVPAGASQTADVTFDAGGLGAGVFEGYLCVDSNDPLRPVANVPLTLTVMAPELMFDPANLDFGDVDVGETGGPMTATLTNSGSLEATGLAFDLPEGPFTVDTGACGAALPSGGSCDVSVTFAPTEAGAASASLEVTADGGAAASLPLAGFGVGEATFTPKALDVDLDGPVSDGNGVFEPDELVEVMPSWRNDGDLGASLTGTVSDFTGPDGALYSLGDTDADYGLVESGATARCDATGICYSLGLDDPAVRPAPHWEAAVTETLDDADATAKTWALHIGDSFSDVPRESLFYRAIETLLHSGVTAGCGGTEYCPAGTNSRGQMAVFLLKAVEDADYLPPACEEGEERFLDVAADSLFCSWIEELAAREITTGCGGDNFCPGDSVTRAQMAIFLLKAALGSGYAPPACTEEFADVPCSSIFAAWIEDLAERGITGGCGGDNYCPADAVTRAQMAIFVTRAFGLTLYGP